MTLSQRRSALVRRLHRRKTREREGLVLVEGVRAAREALDADARVRFALLAPSLQTTADGPALTSVLVNSPAETTEVPDAELSALSGTENPQGVLLVCSEPEHDLAATEHGPILVLDALQDPGNVGTLIRSAVAFDFAGVWLLPGSADPWGAKAVRASAGSAFRRPVVRCHLSEVQQQIRQSSLELWAAAADGVRIDRSAGDADRASVCLVVGNEGRGVSAEVRESADKIVRVEMPGPTESLNAAIAGSILMHALGGGAPS
ncbi:MAG: RNA methyltransferase [Gemmatimonadota bacterium]